MHPVPRQPSFAATWLVFGILLGVLGAVWSLATPLPSGPDETTHFVMAGAVVRGELTPAKVPGHPELRRVRIPTAVSDIDRGRDCYYRVTQSAVCRGRLPRFVTGTTNAATYVGEYPPTYYALVGWPTLMPAHRSVLYGMRVVSAALGGVLLGLAFAVVRRWSRHRLLLLGLASAVTPAVIYLNSVLNPSGFEIAAAAVVWSAATVLVLEHAANPPRALVVVLTVSAVLLAFVRPLSPVFALLIPVAVALMRPRAARLLLRARSFRIGGGVIGVAAVVAGVLVLARGSYRVERFPLAAGTTTSELVRRSVEHAGAVTRQLLGAYGSPNFGAPFLVLVLWGGAVLGLLGAALLLLGRREALLLAVGLVLVLLALPLAADLSGGRTYGLSWQGRYELPLAVGFPMLAAALLSERHPRAGRAHLLLPAVLAVGMLVSYAWLVRRYQVGLFGTLNPFPSGPGVWQPPLPAPLLFAAAALTAAGYAVALGRAARPGPDVTEPEAADATPGSLETAAVS